ncbi:MAG: ABC transporter ATP-binding protein [Fuerstiella sp.]
MPVQNNPQMYSVKQPSAWFWRTNFTQQQILKHLEESKISGHWLVCPLGDANRAIGVATFASNPDVFVADVRAKGESESDGKHHQELFAHLPRQHAPPGRELMIRVEGLTYTYPSGSSAAVRELTFDVAKGEVFGFLGPSGAGKTTTQNILIGLIKGWQGDVRVLDRPLAEWNSDYYRSIGVSFEAPNHYLKLTARENLEYFRSLYDGKADTVEEVLAVVGLEDHIDKPVGDFSKGMKNRLNFARSLLHRPKLWFLDEPTAGLDPVNAVRIRKIIRERQELGVTTVVTTHDMTTAEIVCDRVAFIIDGQIATIDTPDALRRRFGSREVEVSWKDDSSENGSHDADGAQRFPLDGLSDNTDFLDALRRPGLSTVHSQEATLEDVFLQVTGRSLR